MARNRKKEEINEFENNTTTENKFTNLKDLVEAPLLAIAGSNVTLGKSIVDYIQTSGTQTTIYNEKVTVLENINLGYQQVKQGDNHTQVIEDMALQVPLLSIMPISNLQIKKAKVDFNAEVRGVEDENHNIYYQARVCAPESRSTDYLSKIHFEIEVESSDMSEGMARCMDVLNLHQIPKKIDTRPTDATGNILNAERQESFEKKNQLMKEINDTNIAMKKLEDFIHTQIINFDSALKNIEELKDTNYDSFMTNNRQNDIKQLLQKDKTNENLLTIQNLYEDIQKNITKKEQLQQQSKQLEQELLNLDIKKVLNK